MTEKEKLIAALDRLEIVRYDGLFSHAYADGGDFSDDLATALWLARKLLEGKRVMDASAPATLWEADRALRDTREALQPFAVLYDWIAENRPRYANDAEEVQIEEWPYTLSVSWLRRARDICRDSDGTATAAVCEDIPVPKDCQARAESIAQTKSVNP